MSLEDFGAYIKNLRVNGNHGSQRAVATKLGVSNSTIAKIESGTHEPSEETMHKLAELFNVNYFDLAEKRHTFSRSADELLFDKIKKLKKSQIQLISSLVDEFLEGSNHGTNES